MKQATRNYIYAVLTAAVPLAITLGLVTDGVASNILTLAGAVLAVGGTELARKNSSRDVIVVPNKPGEYEV